MKRKITITGDLGSGKSTVAKMLCGKLDYNYMSTGYIQREMARSKGMDTLEFNKYSEKDTSIDDYIDSKLKELNDSEGSYVIDSRLGWYFVKDSIKIYFTTLIDIAAQRVLEDKLRKDEPEADNINTIKTSLKLRRGLENERFFKIYGINCDDYNNYDFVVDSSYATPNEVFSTVYNLITRFNENILKNKFWLAPKRIYPTEHIRGLKDNEFKINGDIQNFENIDSIEPIEVVKYQDDFYVWNGHHRLSAFLELGLRFIPCDLIAIDNQKIYDNIQVKSFVESTYNISWLYDWEDMHGFRFRHYPDIDNS